MKFFARFLGISLKGLPEKPLSWQKQYIGLFAILVVLGFLPYFVGEIRKIFPPPFGTSPHFQPLPAAEFHLLNDPAIEETTRIH